MRAEQWLGNGDERERLNRCQTSDFGLVAADMWGVGLVLLKVLWSRWVVNDLVAELEGLLGQRVLRLSCYHKRSRHNIRRKKAEQDFGYK